MTRLEKLKNELSRCEAEIQKQNQKQKEIEEKIKLEEQREIQKFLKEKHLGLEELKSLLE